MPNILGSLQVELTANTAKFVGDLGKAAHAAQQAAQSMSREFASLQRVASATFGAFGEFNPVISQFSFALSSMTKAASSAMKEFGSFKTALGAIESTAAGAVAGFAALGVGVLAIAAHTAESAAKLDELSQSTGVSTEALSGLGFAAKQVGVDQETLVKGLEKMSKSAFAAATAPTGATNAFTRLGVSLRDASGNIRTTEAIFADLAGKFAALPDGIAKTALEMEVFGRNGAAMAPLLDLGKNGIDGMVASAQRFGAVVSGETAEAAERFRMKLGELTSIGDGFSLSLMRNMLPLLNATATSFESSAEGANTWARAIGQLARAVIVPLDAVFTAINLAAIAAVEQSAQIVYAFEAVGRAGKDLATFNFTDLANIPTSYMKTALDSLKDSFQSSKKEWSSLIDFINNTSPDNRTGWMVPLHPHGHADTAGAGRLGPVSTIDVVGEAVGKLQAEAAAQLALAGATDRSTAAMLFQKAAGEAQQKVSDLRVGLLAQEKTLEEQLANARANPTTAGGEESAKIEARIAGVHKELAALSAAAPQFTRFYAQIAAAKASSSTSGELQKKSDDFDKQITSLREVAAAYGKGPVAIASAAIDKQLEGEKEKIDDLRDEYAQLQGIAGIGVVGSAQGQGPSPALANLAAAITAAEAKLDELKKKAIDYEGIRIDAEIGKESAAFRGEAGAIAAVTAAYLKSESARRAAQVGTEVAKFKTENPAASDPQIEQFRALAQARSEQAYASSIAQVAAEYQVQGAYDRTREKLEAARAALVASGESTLAIDDKIYNDEISHREELARLTFDAQNSELLGLAKLYDANRKQIEQWDQAAQAAGTFGQKMSAVLNQIALDAENVGGKITDAMDKAIGGVEDNLATLIVTGKSNFKQVFEGFAESVVKAQIQFAAGGLEKSLGIKIPGLQGKRGESAGNPLFVQDVGAGGNLPMPPGFGSGRTLTSILGLGKQGTATTPPFLPEGSATSSGGVLGSIGKVFGTLNSSGGPTGSATNSSEAPGLAASALRSSASALSTTATALKNSASGLSSAASALKSAASSLSSSGGGGAGGSGSSGMGSLFGGGGGSGDPGSSDTGGGSGSSSGSTWASIMSAVASVAKIFAGGMASGGDVSHRHAYIVGEKGPELFKPDVSGSIIPSFSMMKAPEEGSLSNMGRAFGGFRAAGGDVTPGHSYMVGEKRSEVFMSRGARAGAASSSSGAESRAGTTINMGGFHVNGVQDHDSFRRSQSQIYANLHAAMEVAKARG